jgi:hypothetical protein
MQYLYISYARLTSSTLGEVPLRSTAPSSLFILREVVTTTTIEPISPKTQRLPPLYPSAPTRVHISRGKQKCSSWAAKTLTSVAPRNITMATAAGFVGPWFFMKAPLKNPGAYMKKGEFDYCQRFIDMGIAIIAYMRIATQTGRMKSECFRITHNSLGSECILTTLCIVDGPAPTCFPMYRNCGSALWVMVAFFVGYVFCAAIITEHKGYA